jgi:catechol 2,3-dioxygenase
MAELSDAEAPLRGTALYIEVHTKKNPAGEIRGQIKVTRQQLALFSHGDRPARHIGHVHLKVADLDRSLRFYRNVLGFDVMQQIGDSAAFLSAGGYHHHIAINTWESKGGSPPPRGTTGLYHVAIRYPDRKALGDALRRVLSAGIPLEGATDHGVSEALYLRDPDS